MPDCVRISTGSRLHLGMFSFGRADRRSFGGVGLMVDRPGFMVSLRRASVWRCTGPFAKRVLEIARRCAEHASNLAPTAVIEIVEAPPQHAGLGSGTQLAMAIAAGLETLATGTTEFDDPFQLATRCGRGFRSAIGLQGFVAGGLLHDPGKLASDAQAPQAERSEVPADWRFLLISPEAPAGLSGAEEQTAFDRLPPVPLEITRRLEELAVAIIAAVRENSLNDFSTAVLEYGQLAGRCYADVQSGDYSSDSADKIVGLLQSLGCPGVFQSSWGPTLVAAVGNLQQAQHVQSELVAAGIPVTLAAPLNHGAKIEVLE